MPNIQRNATFKRERERDRDRERDTHRERENSHSIYLSSKMYRTSFSQPQKYAIFVNHLSENLYRAVVPIPYL